MAGQFGGYGRRSARKQTATGYEVAWKVPGADQYTVWTTDSSGNYISSIIGAVSGTSTALESLETSFHQDLNGDGVIGIPTTVRSRRSDRPAWSRSATIIFSITSAAGLAPS